MKGSILFETLYKSNAVSNRKRKMPKFPFLSPRTHGQVNQYEIATQKLIDALKKEQMSLGSGDKIRHGMIVTQVNEASHFHLSPSRD